MRRGSSFSPEFACSVTDWRLSPSYRLTTQHRSFPASRDSVREPFSRLQFVRGCRSGSGRCSAARYVCTHVVPLGPSFTFSTSRISHPPVQGHSNVARQGRTLPFRELRSTSPPTRTGTSKGSSMLPRLSQHLIAGCHCQRISQAASYQAFHVPLYITPTRHPTIVYNTLSQPGCPSQQTPSPPAPSSPPVLPNCPPCRARHRKLTYPTTCPQRRACDKQIQ